MLKLLAKFYIYCAVIFKHLTKYNLHGIGFVQRKLLRQDFIFNFKNKKFFYDHTIEGSYDYLLIGKSNEPETQIFLNKVIRNLNQTSFIDIGASIGEFVFFVSNFENIKQIYAFEPRPDCADVLRKNSKLNNESRITVYENAVSDKLDTIKLHLNPGGTSSGLYSIHSNAKSIEVKTVTLDSTLPEKLENPIMLIDVEGAEPFVLKGAKSFISKNKPLIIFEYNNTSKKHFSLNEIQLLLGKNYSIFRLKGDGTLDQDFSNSWNAVAIPVSSAFDKILLSNNSSNS